jgi:LuxR family transcriptional regulator, maltose regulon positive regulatory protein
MLAQPSSMSAPAVIPRRAPARLTLLDRAQRRPAFGPGLVARARLVRRLMLARDVPLVVLSAPAGYGKTTLLLDWAQHDPRSFAWAALDRADDDPAHLLASVARATGGPRQRGSASVLVLDGVDNVRSSEAVAVLAQLAEHPPAGAQVVLVTREEPPVRLGRLRAQRDVFELHAGDFVMTRAEAAELLDRAGLRLNPVEVDALVARTEGWPVGLYLAALSLREQPDGARAVAEFGGDDRVVADYIADAVLADLSAEQVAFLRRTSVLERLSGPLCDHVLGEEGTAALLKALARANIPLVALDRTDQWYRYQRVFAQALRAELRRSEPGLEPELHRCASRWHAAHGNVDEAIRHAAAAGDVDLAGDLVSAHAMHYLAEGHHGSVRRWLAQFTDEQLSSCPPLALAAASSHVAQGERDLAEHWNLVAARALRGARETSSLEAGAAAMRAAIARDGVARMRDDALRAYELADDDSAWRALACQLEGAARHLLGDPERADALLREGVRRGVVAAPWISALCLAQLALLALELGDRHGSAELANRARTQVERLRLGDEPAMSLVLAVSALIKAQLGQMETAKAEAGAAARLLDRLADVAPWYRAEVAIALARAMVHLTDVAAARTLLEDASRAVRCVPDAAALTAWLDDARAEADAYATSATATPASLTIAELRILRMLPTHLSFREMGSQIYVSPNTVKTQAQAVYRKLDASSRSEAVARARELGLLEAALTE